MDCANQRGRGGRPKATNKKIRKVRTSFSWSKELKERMASYVRDNYANYRESLAPGKKILFLRKMRESLQFNCDDKQLQNGFSNLLKPYLEVKQKLTSSGFGIDPDKDSSLNYGWIRKKCPYFEILDEVMGCRPNVTPPTFIATANFEMSAGPEANDDMDEMDIEVNDDRNEDDSLPDEEVPPQLPESPQSTNRPENVQSEETPIQKYVREAVSKITVPRDDSKTPMGMFSKVMTDKMEQVSQIEHEKMAFEEKRFQTEMEVKNKNLELTREIEFKKLDLEKEKLKERALEREHELSKLQMSQDFEIRKLELQLQLKKA